MAQPAPTPTSSPKMRAALPDPRSPAFRRSKGPPKVDSDNVQLQDAVTTEYVNRQALQADVPRALGQPHPVFVQTHGASAEEHSVEAGEVTVQDVETRPNPMTGHVPPADLHTSS